VLGLVGVVVSAWDVAGLFVWAPLAWVFWIGGLSLLSKGSASDKRAGCFGYFGAIIFGGAAVFCVARLCGAHA